MSDAERPVSTPDNPGEGIWFPSMTPEGPEPEWVKRQREMLRQRREANNFCEQVTTAAELAKSVKELSLIAQRAGSQVMQRTMFTKMPYRLEVQLEEGTEAFTVRDDNIIDDSPSSFVADELRSIGEHGVEFYDRQTDTWLKIRGFDFELSPLFPDEPTE